MSNPRRTFFKVYIEEEVKTKVGNNSGALYSKGGVCSSTFSFALEYS